MAELVDALGSGSSGRMPVGVRVPPSAPINQKGLAQIELTLCNFVGAEGGTRTPTGIHPLDPEPSASTSSATSAQKQEG